MDHSCVVPKIQIHHFLTSLPVHLSYTKQIARKLRKDTAYKTKTWWRTSQWENFSWGLARPLVLFLISSANPKLSTTGRTASMLNTDVPSFMSSLSTRPFLLPNTAYILPVIIEMRKVFVFCSWQAMFKLKGAVIWDEQSRIVSDKWQILNFFFYPKRPLWLVSRRCTLPPQVSVAATGMTSCRPWASQSSAAQLVVRTQTLGSFQGSRGCPAEIQDSVEDSMTWKNLPQHQKCPRRRCSNCRQRCYPESLTGWPEYQSHWRAQQDHRWKLNFGQVQQIQHQPMLPSCNDWIWIKHWGLWIFWIWFPSPTVPRRNTHPVLVHCTKVLPELPSESHWQCCCQSLRPVRFSQFPNMPTQKVCRNLQLCSAKCLARLSWVQTTKSDPQRLSSVHLQSGISPSTFLWILAAFSWFRPSSFQFAVLQSCLLFWRQWMRGGCRSSLRSFPAVEWLHQAKA